VFHEVRNTILIIKEDARRMKHPKNFDENLESYEVFYLEIPKAEYMDDIEIQDEYDKPEQEQLTTDESSDYTRASLEAAKDQPLESDDKSDE
jgi:hypothetical protein